jgi:hypothetical protein
MKKINNLLKLITILSVAFILTSCQKEVIPQKTLLPQEELVFSIKVKDNKAIYRVSAQVEYKSGWTETLVQKDYSDSSFTTFNIPLETKYLYVGVPTGNKVYISWKIKNIQTGKLIDSFDAHLNLGKSWDFKF